MWKAYLVDKTESPDAVEAVVEFRSDQPGVTPVRRTVRLSPTIDNIVDAQSARLRLREKTSVILNDLNAVERLGDMIEANLGAEIQPVAVPPPG